MRLGDTVRRPLLGAWEFRHKLLHALEVMGFDAAPRYLGLDKDGREVLTFIDGEVPSECQDIIWTDEQLREAGRLLRRFHDATAGSELAGKAEVVCHNDFGPWNLVWRHERPIAIIDFDEAAPGRRIDDFGYAVWKTWLETNRNALLAGTG